MTRVKLAESSQTHDNQSLDQYQNPDGELKIGHKVVGNDGHSMSIGNHMIHDFNFGEPQP